MVTSTCSAMDLVQNQYRLGVPLFCDLLELVGGVNAKMLEILRIIERHQSFKASPPIDDYKNHVSHRLDVNIFVDCQH